MTRDDRSNDAGQFLPPEFHGGTPWVMNMDDAQRKAHAAQMAANAKKTLAEASEIRNRNGWQKFYLGLSYVGVFIIVFGVGLFLGAVFWSE
jgi:hypothetical protein